MKPLFLIPALLMLMALVRLAPAIDNRSDRDTRSASGAKTQVGFSTIVVNGRALTGPNSAAQMRDGRLYIPIAAIARALGDSVLIDTANSSLSVLLQTGVRTAFDARSGQVFENGSAVLSISNPGQIVISPFLDELMLPVEIVSPLFGVSIRFEKEKNVVQIGRGIAGIVTQQKEKRGIGEIYLAEYEYNLNRYFSSNSHDLSINAIGRLGDGRFSLVSNSSASSIGKFSPRNFTFNLERPNGHNYIAGDLGAAAGLQLIASNVRGGLVSIPVGNFTIAAFGGRANSGSPTRGGTFDEPGTTVVGYSRDTNIFGVTTTTKPFGSGPLQPLIVTAGGMRFSGSGRTGNVAATSFNFGGRRAQFQTEVGFGQFSGTRNDGSVVDGPGAAFEVSGTYQVTENLSFQARFAHVGSSFLAPQTGSKEPVDLKAGGVAWSPTKWLTTSLTASSTKRPNRVGSAESYISSSVAISPGGNKPTFYISHTQSSSQNFRKGEFTLLNVSKNFQRVRLFGNASRVKNFGPASANFQVGANVQVNDRNTIELNQGFASQRSSNGLIEWRTNRFFSDRINLAAGLGYNYNPSGGITSYQKLSANINLPRESMLQVNYLNTSAGPTILVKLRGLLFRKRDATAYLDSLPSEVNSFSRVSGRVYQDIDGDGKYDAAVDKPQANVKVRVDGNRYVETDVNGLFAFDALQSGERKVYVDLLSVRADLTLLDSGARNLILEPGRTTQFDFRLVRTGRVTGRVWLDTNGNGVFDKGESPLADVRIVTASGRDTLSDSDGNFTVADLPPGEHIFYIDEKTLPEKMIPATKPTGVQSFAGRETADVLLAVIPTPAEVKRFGSEK